jgi:uncharacterized protein
MSSGSLSFSRSGRTVQGVGIGLRRDFHDELLTNPRATSVDWLEIVAENFMGLGGRPQQVLAATSERWPLVAHGVALSVGGPDSLAPYLEAVKPLLDELAVPFFTDHLCYASLGGFQTFDLLPLPFHEAAVEHVAARARETQDRLERPLLLENITYYATMPGSTLDEATFLTAVLDAADCGLLLDLTNVYVNALNHGQDPRAQLARLPLARVGQIHLAGPSRDGDVFLDTHSTPVPEPVWDLYRETLARTGPVPTLIEWDQHIPSLDAVLDQADRARQIHREARPLEATR